MSNNTTEQALIQIEKNLNKLDSARKQVLDLTSHGKEISTIMIDLVEKIQKVYNIINFESSSFIEGYQKSQKKLDQNTEKLLDKSRTSITLFLEQFSSINEQLSGSMDKTIKSNSVKSATFLTNQQTEFEKHIKVLSDFNKVLESFKKSIVNTDLIKSSDIDEVKFLIKKTTDNIVTDIDFSENVHIDNHKKLTQLVNDIHKENLKLSKLSTDRLSTENSKKFDGVKLVVEETFNKIRNAIDNCTDVYVENQRRITEMIDITSEQNINLHRENNELLKLLNKKLDSNKGVYFYVTWFIIFFGLIVTVYLIKRF